jgi:hypothetical protein
MLARLQLPEAREKLDLPQSGMIYPLLLLTNIHVSPRVLQAMSEDCPMH